MLHIGCREVTPRGRGWFVAPFVQGDPGNGYPAWAWMVLERFQAKRGAGGLPRVGVDGSTISRVIALLIWVTPRGRGWFPQILQWLPRDAGYPAWAWMVPMVPSAVAATTWLPRVGVDGSSTRAPPVRSMRVTPRGRGWFCSRTSARRETRGYPAWAWMVRQHRQQRRDGSWLPRVGVDGS